MNHYDANNECTPIHTACIENNIEILKLLLEYDPSVNVNALWLPNTAKVTTMHIAANNANVAMMKLLIQHRFDCDKFINNIMYFGDHRSVFLELCFNGNVECLDYSMNHDQCKNAIDIWQRDIYGQNGLQIAVMLQHLPMVKYLLNNLYNDEMKKKIFNQTVGISGTHISSLAAEKGTTQKGLCIFKLLRQNKCPIHPDAIRYAANNSPLIVDYMLNEQLYPNYNYLSNDLMDEVVRNARVHLVHKNVSIIVKYLSNMKIKHQVSIREYKEWIINIFYNIMMHGSMDGYFKIFQEIIGILLKHGRKQNDDWKCFIKSKIIDETLLLNLEKKINDETNVKDICDGKWCLLLKTLIDSFNDNSLLTKYDEQDESDCKKTKDKDNSDDFYCNKNHVMIKINLNDNAIDDLVSPAGQCIYCSKSCSVSLFLLECCKCQEYICKECMNSVIGLIQMLKKEQFDRIQTRLGQCTRIQQTNLVKTVESQCMLCFDLSLVV